MRGEVEFYQVYFGGYWGQVFYQLETLNILFLLHHLQIYPKFLSNQGTEAYKMCNNLSNGQLSDRKLVLILLVLSWSKHQAVNVGYWKILEAEDEENLLFCIFIVYSLFELVIFEKIERHCGNRRRRVQKLVRNLRHPKISFQFSLLIIPIKLITPFLPIKHRLREFRDCRSRQDCIQDGHIRSGDVVYYCYNGFLDY